MVVFWKATETTKPIMIPKAVHICHIIVKAPRMFLGADSAAYTGVVDDFAPTAKPSAKRAINRLTQLLAAAIQMPVMNEIMQEMNIVPRRPK
jgi:hypothetical protein